MSTDPRPSPNDVLAASWSYLWRVAHRAAYRLGIEPEELLQEFAVAVLEWAGEFDAARGSVEQFAFYWAKRVIARPHWDRWKRTASLDELPPGVSAIGLHAPSSGPADLAERADDVARLRVALLRLSPRRRKAVEVRFGLDAGGEIRAGKALGAVLGVRPTTASDLVRAALIDLASELGADPAGAMVSRAEGISSGQRRRARELAGK